MSSEKQSGGTISYRNVVLTVICGLLVLLCVRGLGDVGFSGEAQAAGGATPFPNAAAQRIQMIQELKEIRTIAQKLGSIERTVETRLSAVEQRLTEQTAIMRTDRRRGRNEEVE